MRPSALRTIVAGLASLLLWQAAFVAPAPVLAVDPPDLPPYIDCGEGFVCGGPNPNLPPSGNIEVTGFEDRIVQDTSFDIDDPNDISAVAAWGPLEVEAKAAVAALHGVDIDSRLTDFARNEIRAFMFARLLDIAEKPAAQRSPMEQTALSKLVNLVKQKRVLAAQNAVDEYASWDLAPCAYTWPPELSGAEPYYERDGVAIVCEDHDPNTNPASPLAEEFAAAGAAMAFPELTGDPQATDIASDVGEAFIGMAALGTVAAGLTASTVLLAASGSAVGAAAVGATAAASATLANPAVAAVTAAAIANPAVAAIQIANPAVAAATVANPAVVVPQAAAAVSATSVAAVVAIAIFALVVIAISTWQFVEQASIPVKLNQKLADAEAETPDINALAQYPADFFQALLIFTSATLPDYSDQRPDSVDPHTSSDPDFTRILRVPALPPNFIEVGLPPSATIDPIDWDGTQHTVYMSSGWFVDQPDGGGPTYSLEIEYVNWEGEHWRAAVAGDSFIHTRDDHPDDSFDSPTIEYLDGAGFMRIERHSNRPPSLRLSVQGYALFQEGDTFNFHAIVSDPDSVLPGGDPVAVTWLIEPPSHSADPLIIAGGKSDLERCYTDPVGTAQIVGGIGFAACPWAQSFGTDVSYTYTDSNGTFQEQLHVRAIATDSHGASESRIFLLTINNLPPDVTLTSPSTHNVSDGESVTVSGSFDDPGNDQVELTINWGDGHTTVTDYPCFWPGLSPSPCIGIHAPGAAHPTSFSFGHVYHLASGESVSDYLISASAEDDDGGTGSETQSVHVTTPSPLPAFIPVGNNFGTVAVGDTAAYAFALNNIGDADLNVTGFHFSGTSASSYSLGTTNCLDDPVLPSGACTVWVNFSPVSAGTRNASIVVDSNAAPTSATLTGVGTALGTITVVQDSVPNSARDFVFDRVGPGGTVRFRLDDAPLSNLPATRTTTNLPAGTYVIDQQQFSKWALTDIDCGPTATIDLAAHTATFDIADGDHITCTFTNTERRPDGALSLTEGGSYIGDNVYLTRPAASQTLGRTIAAGSTGVFYLRLQNDRAGGILRLAAAEKGSARLSMIYTVDNVDVTSQIRAGTFATGVVASGDWVTVKVTVAVAPGTRFGRYRTSTLRLTSPFSPGVVDVLRLRSKVP